MKETAYLLQAALIGLWWLGLTVSSDFFAAFQFAGIPATAFWAFMLPDIVLLASLSVVRAYWEHRSIEWMVLGAFGYATLYCCNASALTSSGYLSTGLMVVGFLYNVFLCFSESVFRRSETGWLWNSIKTGIQVVCVWGLTLVVIPFVILDAFDSSLVPTSSLLGIIGGLIFGCFSTLGLCSAYYMVRYGGGTPLPLDQANHLVVSGPYRFVRNPMAVAGIGQGLALALVYASLPLLIYALLGAFIWHVVVRPFEERDLVDRFGEPYLRYRENVKCWIPRWYRVP